MIRTTLVLTAVLTATVSAAPAQSCSLSIIGGGLPGTVLRFQVQGNAGDYTAVIVSDQSGPFSLPLPNGVLALDVLQPWTVLETGFADAAGFAVSNITLPAALTPLSLFGQGVVLRAPFQSIQVCATNSAAFSIG